MRENHLWNRAKEVKIQTGPEITGGFSVGFDSKIPEETKDILMDFIYWVEDRFPVPVTLWVDFQYKHYLVNQNGQRVGYKFYWADFKTYPVFEKWEDIPVIELPVRAERRTNDEILTSFIEAISAYYLWLTNRISDDTISYDRDVQEILQAYLKKQ